MNHIRASVTCEYVCAVRQGLLVCPGLSPSLSFVSFALVLGGHSDLRIPVGSSCGRCPHGTMHARHVVHLPGHSQIDCTSVTPGVMLVTLPFRPAVERCLLHGPSPVGSDMVVGLLTSTVTGNDLGGRGVSPALAVPQSSVWLCREACVLQQSQ